MRKILFAPDPPEPATGSPAPDPKPEPKTKPGDPGKPPGDPEPAKPPATPPITAKAVLEGTKTERELTLEKDLEGERATRKQREQRLAELEDENRTLKTPKPNPPRPAPEKKNWHDGGTFFH